jgi:flagellar hook-associated protein 2
MASGTLAVGGLMSGIDTESMFTQLREAYRKPVELMETRKADYNVKLSAYSTLQAKLTALRASAKEMDTSSEFASLSATSSDEDVLTATTISTAKDMTYNFQVKALAQTHKVATASTYSSTATLGAGNLTIQVGNNTARTITIDSSDTIKDIADAINNDSSMDVVAATVYDGSKYRLMISAKESGDENIVNITVDSSSLSQLAYDNFKTKSASIYDTFSAGKIYINSDYYVNVDANDTMQDVVDKINNPDYWYNVDDDSQMDATTVSTANFAKAVLVTDHSTGQVFIRADGVDSWYTDIEELRVDGTYMEDNMYYKSEVSFESDADDLSTYKLEINGNPIITVTDKDLDLDVDIDDVVSSINDAGIPGVVASTVTSILDPTHKHLKITGIQANSTNGSPDIDFSNAALLGPPLNNNSMHVNSKNMTRSQYGQDATIVLDGTTIKRDSNSIDDMLTGVTLDLKKTSYNSTTASYETLTLDVSRDSTAMVEKFEALAEAYNDLVDFFEEYQGVKLKEDETSKTLEDGMKDLITILSGEELEEDDDSPIDYGPLMGDSTTSMIKNKLFNISFADVNGVNSSYNNLTEMGITLTYGKMSIDKDKFTAAISANADAVNAFFTNDSTTSQGFAVKLIDAIDNMVENYASDQKGILLARQDGIQSSIDRLDEQIVSQDERINSIMERTRAQFNSLEVLMGQYQTTSSYLASQLASLAG